MSFYVRLIQLTRSYCMHLNRAIVLQAAAYRVNALSHSVYPLSLFPSSFSSSPPSSVTPHMLLFLSRPVPFPSRIPPPLTSDWTSHPIKIYMYTYMYTYVDYVAVSCYHLQVCHM